jgi:NADPH-dependent 2,4-dienoyl-CoA reductase/sulfur reductase-like enzyme
MNEFELVIVGGGLTSARAIKHYRLAGGDGRVALLTREHSLPYHRPPLSKRYLRGEIEQEDTLVEPKSFYDENDVELVLATDASEVRPRDRAVVTGSGERYRYAKLLLAPGAVPLTPRWRASICPVSSACVPSPIPARFARQRRTRAMPSSSAVASSGWRSLHR